MALRQKNLAQRLFYCRGFLQTYLDSRLLIFLDIVEGLVNFASQKLIRIAHIIYA